MLNFLTETTEKVISLLAGAFIVAAQITLVADVLRKKLKPSLLSWVGWALLMGTGLIAQVVEMGWEWSQTGLFFSAFGCLCIVFSALIRKHYLLVRSDFSYLFLGLICLGIYFISKDAWITTVFAILADFIVGIPTLKHAYNNPVSQKSNAWLLGFIAFTFSLIICIGHSLLYALFPIYLFLYNGAMLVLTHRYFVNKKSDSKSV